MVSHFVDTSSRLKPIFPNDKIVFYVGFDNPNPGQI